MRTFDLLGTIVQFFQDARLWVILGLIGLDVVLGIARAIAAGRFEWGKVGQFYRTMVVPCILGYLALYVAFKLVPGLEGVVGEGLEVVGFGAIVANLVGSIVDHVKKLGWRSGNAGDNGRVKLH